MVQGTTSDAGKTTIVAGLCRLLARRQFSIAPFKPQNMALNSAVTREGGEIGRSQALQAQACFLQPANDMNPVLLKPSSDTGAQVIIQGQVHNTMNATEYHDYKRIARDAVLQSHERLQSQYELIIAEGAGSPAEINLRENDIANMGFAEAVDCSVILVADIDRGGVFAHLVGTLELLSASERKRVKGFIINRFRGDYELLRPGVEWLETYTGIPVLGVIPYIQGLHLDAEDAINSEQADAGQLNIVVPVLPRISNHTDFDVLRLHPQVNLQFIGPGQVPPPADLIILPGSKHVRQDLQWLKDNHWETAIQTHLRYQGKLMGICGGYQMLGNTIADPEGIEGSTGCSPGLELLDFDTILYPEKQLCHSDGILSDLFGSAPVKGYEIHCGACRGRALERPLLTLSDGRQDGVISPDQQIIGTYLHGVFDHPQACQQLLQWAGLSSPEMIDAEKIREAQIDRLANVLEQHLDISSLIQR